LWLAVSLRGKSATNTYNVATIRLPGPVLVSGHLPTSINVMLNEYLNITVKREFKGEKELRELFVKKICKKDLKNGLNCGLWIK